MPVIAPDQHLKDVCRTPADIIAHRGSGPAAPASAHRAAGWRRWRSPGDHLRIRRPARTAARPRATRPAGRRRTAAQLGGGAVEPRRRTRGGGDGARPQPVPAQRTTGPPGRRRRQQPDERPGHRTGPAGDAEPGRPGRTSGRRAAPAATETAEYDTAVIRRRRRGHRAAAGRRSGHHRRHPGGRRRHDRGHPRGPRRHHRRHPGSAATTAHPARRARHRPAQPPRPLRRPATEVWGLVERAQAGEAEAFGLIYDRYVDTVFRFIYFRVGNRQLAEDLTSDTFLRALKRIGSFTWQGRDLGAWLVTIARNLVADHFKSGRYRLEVTTGDVLDADREDRGPEGSPEAAVVEHITNVALLTAVKQLNPEQQECIVLRFLQGFSVAETARAMGKNEGAIKALQYRAVRALARLLPDGFRS